MAKNGLNQRQMAQYLDVHETQLSRWLKLRAKPRKAWTELIKYKLRLLKETE